MGAQPGHGRADVHLTLVVLDARVRGSASA
jgi:hypothetical protein